jgi:hypothetical protein
MLGWRQIPLGRKRLSLDDLGELNRWLCVTRLRAAAGIFACATALRWLAAGDVALWPLLLVCAGLTIVSVLGLRTRLPAVAPWAFFYGQSLADLGAITIGIATAAGPVESLIFRFIYALVIVPVALVSVGGGLAVVGLATAGHLGLLYVQAGVVDTALLHLQAITYPSLFLLVAQQCFFYGSRLAGKNAALSALAGRLDEHRAHLLAQAAMSDALLDVARSLSATLDAPELLERLKPPRASA